MSAKAWSSFTTQFSVQLLPPRCFIDPSRYIRLRRDRCPLSEYLRNSLLVHQYARTCLPCYRISINPPTLTPRSKLPVRISMPYRTFGALLLRIAPPFASGPSPSRLRTSDAINDETGMTRCLAMKSMHFIDRCFPVAAASRPLLAVIDPIHDIAVTSSIGLKMTALTSTLMLFCTG